MATADILALLNSPSDCHHLEDIPLCWKIRLRLIQNQEDTEDGDGWKLLRPPRDPYNLSDGTSTSARPRMRPWRPCPSSGRRQDYLEEPLCAQETAVELARSEEGSEAPLKLSTSAPGMHARCTMVHSAVAAMVCESRVRRSLRFPSEHWQKPWSLLIWDFLAVFTPYTFNDPLTPFWPFSPIVGPASGGHTGASCREPAVMESLGKLLKE